MLGHFTLDPGQAVLWQTATAVVQAVMSITLLGWYVLAAHLNRSRTRSERSANFDSLVMLCRDLEVEAKEKTLAYLRSAGEMQSQCNVVKSKELLEKWRADMTIIYVCLNEVPHYEVRNPTFSIALTRLWRECDPRRVDLTPIERPRQISQLLNHKFDRICLEVDAMERLLETRVNSSSRGWSQPATGLGRPGKAYSEQGFARYDT